MNRVEDLDVFKLALRIYSVTKTFPGEETYSLVDQMRRAAISVGMNLMGHEAGHQGVPSVRRYRERIGW